MLLISAYLCFNKEDFISRYNLENGNKIDYNYILSLSPHSLPALFEHIEITKNDDLIKELDLKNYLDNAYLHLKDENLKNKILKNKLIKIQNDFTK